MYIIDEDNQAKQTKSLQREDLGEQGRAASFRCVPEKDGLTVWVVAGRGAVHSGLRRR